MDEYYTYDNLNRLTEMQRGQLTGGPPPTGISGTPVREQDWTLDPTGNWSSFTTSTGTGWATPAYDDAGNITTLPQPASLGSGYTGVYDAWNRLVKLSSGATTIATYSYDGRGRRVVKVTPAISETRHFYWSNQWQVLEER